MTTNPQSAGPESSPLHVLVLEDEDAHAELIRRGFRPISGKFRISLAQTLQEARSILTGDPPDLIIADWLLPDGKGIEILPKKDGLVTTPLIIMTSHGDENLAVEMMKAGAIDYLVKSDVAFKELPHIAERALREWKNIQQRKRSEERFHLLLENSGSGIGYYDLAGNLILFNRTAAQYMGGSPADFAGESVFELYNKDLADQILKRFKVALSDTDTRFYEDLVPLETGTRWFSSAYTAVRDDEHGEIVGVQIISTDIAPRKNAEQALRESEERYRVLVDHVPDTILVHRFGVIQYINPAGAEAFGYTPDELCNTPISRYIDPACRDRVANAMRRRMNGEEVPPYEIVIVEKSGRRRTVIIYGSLIELHNGPAILNVLTDITDRKNAENSLRDSEERFRHISSLISDFAYSCEKVPGSDFVIDWMTGSTEQITGYSAKEIHDQSCWKFLVLEDDLPLFEKQVTGLAPGESARCELRIRHKDGRIVWLASFAECVLDPKNPSHHRLFGGCRDVTERKRAEQSMQIATRKLNLMNMVAWHDIQNKLTGLWGYIELTKDLVSDAQVMKFLEIEGEILHVIHRQIASTKEYQEMGVQTPQWLNIEGIMRSIRISGKTSSLQVIVEVDGLEIFGDPVIERVFSHLVENSVQHGQTVTEIRLGYRESASGLVLIYEDNGVGIPGSIRSDLFNKSYGKTTGFDLFFVHDLLEASGMAITETGTPGKGAKFEITVPREAYRFVRTGEGPCSHAG